MSAQSAEPSSPKWRRDIADFVYTAANEAACSYTLLPHGPMVGHTVLGLLPAHQSLGLLGMYRQVVDMGEPLVLAVRRHPCRGPGW